MEWEGYVELEQEKIEVKDEIFGVIGSSFKVDGTDGRVSLCGALGWRGACATGIVGGRGLVPAV